MVEPDSIATSIRAGMAVTHLEVTGDGASTSSSTPPWASA